MLVKKKLIFKYRGLSVALLCSVCAMLAAATVQEADALYDRAMDAMAQMNDDSSKSVEAAVYLQEAKTIYAENERWPRVREVNSYIFFCKKKMNVSELDSYVSTLGRAKAKEVRETFRIIESEVSSSFSSEDAAISYREAGEFAQSNPDEFLKIHMRYLEISERAIETNASLAVKASRKSSDALQSWVAVSKTNAVTFISPFKKPQRTMDLMGGDGGFPIPGKSELKKVVKSLQTKFGAQFKKPRGNAVPRELFKMAQESLDQPVYSYACVIESARLSLHKNVNDASLLMKCFAFLEKNFAIVDPAVMRSAIVSKQRSKIAKAVLALFKNQRDAPANKVVGLSYCFVGNNWSQGMDLLSAGGDKNLTSLVAMEKAKPSNGVEQKQLADGWYDLSKDRAYKDYAASILRHSCKWYIKAKPRVSGISKEQIVSRLLAAASKLPIRGLENVSTAKQNKSILKKDEWDGLKAKMIHIDASKGKQFTGVTLLKGQSIRVFPHTYDTWIIGGSNASYIGLRYFSSGGANYGSMQVSVGNGPMISPDKVITGEGKVYVFCSSGGGMFYSSGGTGTIRCKIARVK